MILLPDYTIFSKLYESFHTIVYRSRREKDDFPVIIKVLKEENPSQETIIRYKREYEITGSLNLKGVIKSFGLERTQNKYVLIFEDIGGESLEKIMLEKKLDLREILQIAIKITEILGELQTAHVIHKDINPSNIILNPKTNTLKLIDFGISSLLIREDAIKKPNVLEGNITYISPEQTGRMNRFVDYRTDYYSLGVSLYELLTGRPPFITEDPLELVHCHIAKKPQPPSRVAPEIPQPVSDIVMKLLAKTADDRYQSSWGIKSDLMLCLNAIKKKKTIATFVAAQEDFQEQFKIPQKLYGRDLEMEILLAAFDRINSVDKSKNRKEMVLVSGFSGIGKTSFVTEIYKTIIRKRGFFITGKCKQFQRNIPFSAFIIAFRQLILQLLTGSEGQLNLWREKLQKAFGNNGQAIIDVIPEIEMIVGPQPELLPLPLEQSQNRFNLVAKKFVQLFCQPDHPLVIFFDDLQWADSATIRLIKLMMRDDDIQHLLLIIAYRNNEVDAGHPLNTAVEDLKSNNICVRQIMLPPLAQSHIADLLADTLHRTQKDVISLAELLMRKTAGNPFFLNEFLKTLHQDQMIYLDKDKRQWEWDMAPIEKMDITDNVIDLMLIKLKRLPKTTQEVLSFAACIGSAFDLPLLAGIQNQSKTETYQKLAPAINEGLILPTSDLEMIDADNVLDSALGFYQYKFLHDRVHQAANALIDLAHKKDAHLQIGRILLEQTPHPHLTEVIFDIADHLNDGSELITHRKEKLKLASLNLAAGQKAKDASAYDSALIYIQKGMALLPPSWEEEFDLTLALFKERSILEYFNGDYEAAEAYIQTILDNTSSTLTKGEIYGLLIVQYTMRSKYEEAIQTGIKALRMLSIDVPEKNLDQAVAMEIEDIQKRLVNQKIPSLIDAPEMEAPDKKIVMKILMSLNAVAYFIDKFFYAWILAKMVNISLIHGNAPESAKGYSSFGNILASFLGHYKDAYEFGMLGISLSEKYQHQAYQCQTCMVTSSFLVHWVKHIKNAWPICNKGYQAGMESGELQYVGYLLLGKVTAFYFQGVYLNDILKEIPTYLDISKRFKNLLASDVIEGCLLTLSNITGGTTELHSFDLPHLTENEFIAQCEIRKTYAGICFYRIIKAQILHLYGFPQMALNELQKAEERLANILGFIASAVHNFLHSLCLIALYEEASKADQATYRKTITANQSQMKIWAANCPENFSGMYTLIVAEEARIAGDDFKAMRMYDESIKSSVANGFVQYEGLANELAAKFWLTLKKEEFAAIHLKKAYFAYKTWGANRKVTQMEQQYALFLDFTLAQVRPGLDVIGTGKVSASSQEKDQLDLAAVIKATQAISSEIELSQLMRRLMSILIENAGAQKGVLILKKDTRFFIEAVGEAENQTIDLVSRPITDYPDLAASIVNYVIRTGEEVVLDNAMEASMFMADPYVIREKVRSILCKPIHHHGVLTGVLYLENNLGIATFTPYHLKMVGLFSAQAAISIENAKLFTKYRNLYNNALEGIFQSSVEGRFLNVNPAVSKILGYNAPQDLIDLVTDIEKQVYVTPHDRKEFTRRMKKNGKIVGYETRLYRKDRSIVWVSLSARGVYDTNQNLIYLEGSMLDITERKEREKAVRERETARAASKAKSEFLAQMSHEIRTPMNGVIAAADLALCETLTPKARRYLEIIQSSGFTLLEIINDILDFSKIEAGKLVLEKHPFILEDLLKNIAELFINKIEDKQNELLINIHPETVMRLSGDPLRLKQVLTNLIGNAVKFTQNGKISINVAMNQWLVDQKKAELMFQVKDTGTGMQPDQMQKVFEPFSQAEASTTRKYGGTGLGLSITKQIIEMMDGSIWVESEPAKGAVFYFTVKCTADPLSKIRDFYPWPKTLQKPHILIVERDQEHQRLLARILDYMACQAEFVSHVKEAQNLLNGASTYRILIFDSYCMQTEEQDLLREIKKSQAHDLKYMMITAFNNKDHEACAHSMGVDHFLLKPVLPMAIHEGLLIALGRTDLVKNKSVARSPAVNFKEILKGKRILVVEDNATNQEIAVAILQEVGCIVETAANGKICLEKLNQFPDAYFDLLLMDIEMPELDGYDATRRIRKDMRFKALPIIAMTAHALKGDEEKCMAAGMNGYVTKPIDHLTLLQKTAQFFPTDAIQKSSSSFEVTRGNPLEASLALPATLPGLQIHQAMGKLKFDEQTFLKILKVFERDNRKIPEQLYALRKQNQFTALRQLAHNLKGSAANIGAYNLEKSSRELESICRDESSSPLPVLYVDTVVYDMNEVFTSINRLPNLVQNDASQEMPSKLPEIDSDRLAPIMNDLFAALRSSDPTGALEGIEALKKEFKSKDVWQLMANIEAYEYEEAIEKLRNLAAKLKIPVNV